MISIHDVCVCIYIYIYKHKNNKFTALERICIDSRAGLLNTIHYTSYTVTKSPQQYKYHLRKKEREKETCQSLAYF